MKLHRLDHACLRVADLDEASARWCLQFGLVERGRDGGRALLACNDEPYCLELVEGGRPGHDHFAFELAHDCSLDDARAHLDRKGVTWREAEGVVHEKSIQAQAIERVFNDIHEPPALETVDAAALEAQLAELKARLPGSAESPAADQLPNPASGAAPRPQPTKHT